MECTNRKYTSTDLKEQGIVVCRNTLTGIMALQWIEKHPVTMMSTYHTSEMVNLLLNQQGTERNENKSCSRLQCCKDGCGPQSPDNTVISNSEEDSKMVQGFLLSSGYGCQKLPCSTQDTWREVDSQFKLELERPSSRRSHMRKNKTPSSHPFCWWRSCTLCSKQNYRMKESVMCMICNVSLRAMGFWGLLEHS